MRKHEKALGQAASSKRTSWFCQCEEHLQLARPDDRLMFRRALEEAAANGDDFEYDMRTVAAAGGYQ